MRFVFLLLVVYWHNFRAKGPPLTLDSLQHHRSELRRDAIREVKAYPWFLDEGPVSNEPLERPHPFSLASISPSSTFLGASETYVVWASTVSFCYDFVRV